MQYKTRYPIAIVNKPMKDDVERNFLDYAIRGLRPLCDYMYVIAGNFEKHYDGVDIIDVPTQQRTPSLLQRIANNLFAQIQMVIELARITRKCDIVFYDVGEYRNIIVIAFGKLFRKTTLVYHHGGNKLLEAQLQYRDGAEILVPYVQECMLRLCYHIVDYVLCLSPSIIEFGGLQAYSKKILFFKDFVEVERFKPGTFPSSKQNLIGYIGRLNAKKGIMNIIESLPTVLQHFPDVQLVVAGSGELESQIKSEVDRRGLQKSVTFLPWIPDKSYPEQLNQLKFFLLPSYEEGIPKTVLEAMACGVIPIVTPVGGIPDIVRDG